MSGFATIVNFDGKPVDRQLLAKMADHLTFRGPDEQRIWVGGWNQNVGMVHAKFATTYEAERESQPLTVDGNTWVTGHIRLDAREELWEKLEGKGRQGVRQATDAALLLRAYETWGERCLEHLLGDFGFAVWDERARKLWCATDHMGVRPVFHEQHQQTVVASNTLDCVRLHPDSRDELNELAAADFLVHDFNTDATSTAYAAIGRLEPGSSLSFKDGHATSHIYWDLPIEDPVLGRSDREWCEEFRELAGRAVADRIRTKKIALYMSGGIDSTTLAAITASRLPRSHENLICYCYGFQRLIKDDELHYAALVADKLGLQIRFRYRDNACFDPDWHEKSTRTPEPTTAACSFEAEGALFAEVAGSSRVGFYGEGPDNALKYEFASYLRYLVRSREVATLVQSVFDHLRVHKQLPATRAGLRWLSARTARNREPNPSPDAVLPKWLSRELVARLGLMERYRRVYRLTESAAHILCDLVPIGRCGAISGGGFSTRLTLLCIGCRSR